jgi:indolepyruvate ferredoxin oxidoreductase
MKLLAGFKFLRGTPFDPFGRSAERRQERQLIADYEATVNLLLQKMNPSNMVTAIALASIPESIRGYGPVKDRSIAGAKQKHAELLANFRSESAAT